MAAGDWEAREEVARAAAVDGFAGYFGELRELGALVE